jgi:hypothetical protein
MNGTSLFCKAYTAATVGEFAPCQRQWLESGRTITAEDVIYIHDDFVVRRGIFPEDEVVFDHVTDEWKRFCQERLKFEIPPV